MKSRFKLIVLLTMSLVAFSIPKTVIAATELVTEVCTLPSYAHSLQHTLPTTPGPGGLEAGTCSVCNIAARHVSYTSMHPEGAPADVYVEVPSGNYYTDVENGISTEACTQAGCPYTGPHIVCACGAKLDSVGQEHTRTYYKGNDCTWKRINSNSVTVEAGDEVLVTGYQETFKDDAVITLNGNVITPYCTYTCYPNSTHDGCFLSFSISESGTFNIESPNTPKVYLFSKTDSAGQRFNIYTIHSNHYTGGRYSIDKYLYGDGIKFGGQKFYSMLSGYGPHGSYWIPMYLKSGQRVSMTGVSTSGRKGTVIGEEYELNSTVKTQGRLSLRDGSGNIIIQSIDDYMVPVPYLELRAPYDGWFNVVPEVYADETYSDGCTGVNTAYSVNVYSDAIIVPSLQVTASPTTLTLEKGQSSTLTATATSSTATITYSSNNTNVSTVSTTGTVTATSVGSATITVTATT